MSEPTRPASPAGRPDGPTGWLRPGGWTSVLIAAIAGGLVAVGATLGIQSLVNRPNAPQVPLGGGSRVTITDDTAVASVIPKAAPAVVSILTQDPAAAGASGILVSSDGYIVTNVGVVANAARLMVLLRDDPRRHDARLVDFDCQVGLAVLKVDQVSNLPALTFGDSASVQPGQTVVLLGGALPSRATSARGMVSATGRSVTVTKMAPNSGDLQLSGVIETDARVTPVFNGGPLLNTGGQVVGVVTQATVQDQPASSALPASSLPASFALPANSLQTDVQEIIQNGQVLVPSPGFRSVEVTADQAVIQGGVAGSKITTITPGGPAEKAGLKVGDVVTRLDDQSINLTNPLAQVLRARDKIGQRVTVTYSRGGNSQQVQLVLIGERPACG